MPGGGLYGLVAYGAQNAYISGNPDMTYFYRLYKHHTHFFEESITTAMDGPNELSWDQRIQVRMKVKRLADLLRDVYFTFTLPAIYSKFVDPVERASQYNFAWVRFIGCAAIHSVAVFVGGQKIQEFDGNYIVAKAYADYDTEKFAKFRQLVGDVDELTNPGLGIYGGGSETVGYPTVYPDVSAVGAQANRPSIPARDIHVPLPFWFCEHPSKALPLISLQQHECEIQIQLRSIQELYTVLDRYGRSVRPGYTSVAATAGPQQIEYEADSDTNVYIRNFLTDFDVTPPQLNTFYFAPRIQGTYVYLTEAEQAKFSQESLTYAVNQVITTNYPAVYTREFLDIYAHNLLTRLLIVPRRSDSVEYRNDYMNWTNWLLATKAPYSPTPNIPVYSNFFYSSGRSIPNSQRDIVRGVRILCDGNELQEEKPADYFSRIVPWKYMDGAMTNTGLIVYPFSLSSPGLQPNGSLNSSRIRSIQVDVNVWPLPTDTNYVYDITIYAEALNWFVTASGHGGLKYAL
jgi:hypothetical protein